MAIFESSTDFAASPSGVFVDVKMYDSNTTKCDMNLMRVGSTEVVTTLAIYPTTKRYFSKSLFKMAFSLVGVRDDHDKCLFVLNTSYDELALTNVLPIYAADESGSSDVPGANIYSVSGRVSIDNVANARTIRVLDISNGKIVAETVSNSGTGQFSVSWNAHTANDVLVVATDNYGDEWTASTYYSDGDIVRPTNPSGYVYTVENPGTSGSTEPDWNTGSVTTDGEVTWSVAEFFRPVASGPITPEQIT
ncbi:hypothetical protein [Gynuella sp.]|uniref:hypothetical protein n=1 Tax=Gynuella sp. TaxID=2969146 RepID=UPI003D12FD2B